MIVTTASGRKTTWGLVGCRVLGDETRPRSSYHKRARPLIRDAFPRDLVFEEVKIPDTRLRFDFVIPARRVCVEVQGEQHLAYSEYMHKSKAGFLASLGRDKAKVEFCTINNLGLVLLIYSESDDEWRQRLAQG